MLSVALFLAMVGLDPALPPQTNATPVIIDEIRRLEGDKDPKCYATANRLEDFMYGTPLAFEARLGKIAGQKALVLDIWKQASNATRSAGKPQITANGKSSGSPPESAPD